MTGFSIEEPTCQELAEFLTDYLEGLLPPSHRLTFDRHIADCPDCTLYVEQMRATIVATGEIHIEEISPKVRDQLLSAFRGWAAGGAYD
jgi:anti-sigma factor RsiW